MVFSYNPAACAFGSSSLDIVHAYECPVSIDLNCLRGDEGNVLTGIVQSLVKNARRDIQTEGFDPDTILYTLEVVLKGKKGLQAVQLLSLKKESDTPGFGAILATALKTLVGTGDAVEVVSLKAMVPVHHYEAPEQELHGSDARPAMKGSRSVHWDSSPCVTNIYQWERLDCGNQVLGPSIVESCNTSFLVRPGWKMCLDKYHNAMLETHKG